MLTFFIKLSHYLLFASLKYHFIFNIILHLLPRGKISSRKYEVNNDVYINIKLRTSKLQEAFRYRR